MCVSIKKLGQRLHPQTSVIIHYWLCEYISGTAAINAKDEIDDIKWCTGDEVIKLITSDIYEPIKAIIK